MTSNSSSTHGKCTLAAPMTSPHRQDLLADTTIRGAAFCRALSDATDRWLADLFEEAHGGEAKGVALLAVGGYGRGELAPGSDLDVLLLHSGRRDVAELAGRVWYPIWDANVKLGHAVRTVKEALKLADGDLDTATSFLTVRHLGGDRSLTDELSEKALAQWRKRSTKWLAQVVARVDQRHAEAGEVAFLLEPNLKDGRGGLRDVHALNWAMAADLVMFPGDAELIGDAYDVLLAARVELHRVTGRHRDVLTLDEQDVVANALAYRDADALMAAVSTAARTIAWTSDESWHRVRAALAPARQAPTADAPLATGLVLRGGEVHLESAARPASDPTLVLRAAGAAARHRTRIDRDSLERLVAETPDFPDPWPVGASDDLAALLLCGHDAVPVLEAVDQRGLLVKVLPEWAAVRAKPQRNAYHRYTVDRHLLEATANAAELADRVGRPDLLVFGALLHDIGKGYPGDHTEVGVELVATIAPRMGLPPNDADVLVSMVRHHLLLPDVATRRDLADDATIVAVAQAVGNASVLELLATLTEADSMATGPTAWGPWKAELVAELVDRTAHVLGGGAVHEVAWSPFPSPEVLALMGAMRTSLRGDADRLTVVAPDRPGVFARVAGVLSLHGLDVLSAQAHSDEEGMAASEFRVAAPAHGPVPWDRVVGDLERALDGRLALDARLAERARSYDRPARRRAGIAGPPTVRVHNDASSNATVLEVRCPDRTGVLYRIARALADMLLDIRHAKVQTLAHDVVDSFYVRTAAGTKVTDPTQIAEIERAIVHSVSAT